MPGVDTELPPVGDRERALREVSRASARGELDESALAQLVATRVGELLGCVTSAVIRTDLDWLTIIGYAGPKEFPVQLPKDEPSSSLEAIITGRTARVDRYGSAKRPVGAFIAAQGVTCGLSVPLVIDDRVWGCITVTTRRQGGFAHEEEQWLSSFAELVSAAIANAVAKAELRFGARLEETLREVAVASASGQLDLLGLGQLVAERVSELLNAPSAALSRCDPGQLTMLGQAGTVPAPASVPLDVPSVGRLVAERGETVVIDDYTQLGGPYQEIAKRYAGKGGIGVPIFVAGRLWGCLGAMGPEGGFRADAVELLERFAQLISAALANTEAQSQLQLSEQRHRMVTSVSSDGISDVDIRTGETWWSAELLHTLGYSPDAFAGTYDWVLDEVVHPYDRRRLAAMLIGGEDHPTTVLRMRDATGAYHTMAMRSALERDENRNVVRRVSTFTDVTERETAEAKRVALARELHTSVLENLARTRAHLVTAKALGFRDGDALEEMLGALDTQLATAEDSMRLVSRALRSDTTLLEPRGSISALTDTLAGELRRRDTRLVVDVKDALAADLEAGPAVTAAYAYVLREALLNALQHAEASRVAIEVGSGEGRIRLDVHDDGNGFDPAGPAARRYRVRMEERIRPAAGSFAIRSAPGEGARISLELPLPDLAPPSDSTLEDPAGAADPLSGRG